MVVVNKSCCVVIKSDIIQAILINATICFPAIHCTKVKRELIIDTSSNFANVSKLSLSEKPSNISVEDDRVVCPFTAQFRMIEVRIMSDIFLANVA